LQGDIATAAGIHLDTDASWRYQIAEAGNDTAGQPGRL
jgi:hypothetical protein